MVVRSMHKQLTRYLGATLGFSGALWNLCYSVMLRYLYSRVRYWNWQQALSPS